MQTTILNSSQISFTLQRMALQIAEDWHTVTRTVHVIGVVGAGEVVANILQQHLQKYFDEVPVHTVHLNKAFPEEVSIHPASDFSGQFVLLVDDVSNSGKTLLYAMKPLLQQHPAGIKTAVLVERLHKQFPIQTNYVGVSLATTLQDHIVVQVQNHTLEQAYLTN